MAATATAVHKMWGAHRAAAKFSVMAGSADNEAASDASSAGGGAAAAAAAKLAALEGSDRAQPPLQGRGGVGALLAGPGGGEEAGKRESAGASGPSQFVCPISLSVMTDPVIAADGFTYGAQPPLPRPNTAHAAISNSGKHNDPAAHTISDSSKQRKHKDPAAPRQRCPVCARSY